MQFPQIQIRTTDIQMDYQITKPQQRIKQPQATQTIDQPAAIVEINSTQGRLLIDSSQARSDLGLYKPLEFLRVRSQEGRQEALKGISRRVSEGNQMMMSAGKGQGAATIGGIAKKNHGPKRAGPYNIKFVPKIGSVKINYIPGKTDVNITAQKPKIDVQVNKPIIDYTPGEVNGTMVQRPRVDIDVIG